MASLKAMQSRRPTPQECRAVIDALAQVHGRPNSQNHSAGLQPGCELKEPHTVLDSLVRTILSQNTTDITSQRAYTSLKQSFPAWELVRTAPPGAVESAIRVGGLADIKASRIKAILNSLLEERGELSLEHLRQLPGDDVKQQLSKYKGVGPKSIACVMLFCLGRAECPVDTHVWEISKQLGWVPERASREATYEHLNAMVPDECKYELHVLLVEHGKACPECAKQSTNSKRKSKATTPTMPCPLAPFKSSKTKSSSKDLGDSDSMSEQVAAAAAAAVKVECDGSSMSPPISTAVEVKVEVGCEAAAAVAVKVEDLQQYAFAAAAAATLETEQQVGSVKAEQKQQGQQQTLRKRRRRL